MSHGMLLAISEPPWNPECKRKPPSLHSPAIQSWHTSGSSSQSITAVLISLRVLTSYVLTPAHCTACDVVLLLNQSPFTLTIRISHPHYPARCVKRDVVLFLIQNNLVLRW